MKRRWVAGVFVAPLMVAPSVAWAQGKEARPEGKGSNDYVYKFEDDPLSAGGLDTIGMLIKVRTGPVRLTLIRPRTSFVTEMLKSVEHI